MSENIDNLILEHLRAIRADMTKQKDTMEEIKYRLISIDERLTLVEKGVANLHGDMAFLQSRMDKQGERIERIETRLELASA